MTCLQGAVHYGSVRCTCRNFVICWGEHKGCRILYCSTIVLFAKCIAAKVRLEDLVCISAVLPLIHDFTMVGRVVVCRSMRTGEQSHDRGGQILGLNFDELLQLSVD